MPGFHSTSLSPLQSLSKPPSPLPLTSTRQSNAAASHRVKFFTSLGADAQEGAFHILTRRCSTHPLERLTLVHICKGAGKRCCWEPALPPFCPSQGLPSHALLPATYLSNAAHPWHFRSPGHRYTGRSQASCGIWHGHHTRNCSGTHPHLQESHPPLRRPHDPAVGC